MDKGEKTSFHRPRGFAIWIAYGTVWAATLLGVSGLVGGAWWVLRTPESPNSGSSVQLSALLETGASLKLEIAKTVGPAMQRTENLAKDEQVVQLLATSDIVGQGTWLNHAVTTGTEVDALALFDSTGQITAINTQYADGKPISPSRVRRILDANFGNRDIIQKCLTNGATTSLLEFQTHCDITPALFDSTGLSVAYSVPIFNSNGTTKVGVISARLRFDRLSNLIQDRIVAGGAAKAYFVTDAGEYFSETINAGSETPPIPVAELHNIVKPLIGQTTSQVLNQRADNYIIVMPLVGFHTLEGGGIHTLIIADGNWLMHGTRRDRLLQAAAAGLASTLLLIVAGLIHARLAARRMGQTIEAANAANARLASIVQSSTDAIIGTALDGTVISWNPAAKHIFGYEAAEVYGHNLEFLEPPERRQEIANLRANALNNKPVENVETQRLRKDGQRIDVSVSLSVIEDSDGAAVGMAATLRDNTRQKRVEHELRKAFDEMERRVAERTGELSHTVQELESQITERTKAETSLRESETRFRQLAENTKDVFWMVSVAGDRILYVSPRYEEIWGRTCSGLYNDPRGWIEAIEPEDRPAVMKVRQELPVTDEYEVEYRIRRPDGTIRWIRDRALPVRDADGEIQSIAGIAEDFTERRAVEQQIIEARITAENASRAKSEFLANMSHEIRTPLNGVIGMLELLLGTHLGDQQQRYTHLAATSAESLTSLLNDILDLSKIEAGKLDINIENFDLCDTVDDAIDMLSQKAAKKQLDLICNFEADVPHFVRGDPDRLRQILINMVNNAIKFTEKGAVTVRVSAEQISEQKSMIRMEVRDTGVGIPANRMERLFKSFSQVDSSTSRKYGGTGLGLAICKQLAELMGGQIGVQSVEGQGSTFWVTVALELQPARQSASQSPAIDHSALRVLVLDDRAIQRDALLHQIGTWGMTVDGISDCEQAFRLLDRGALNGNPYHVAIVAAEMPRHAWSALAANVRQAPALARTALIAVGAIDSQLETHEMKQLGFNALLTAPVRQSTLFDAISDAISSANKSSTSAKTEVMPEEPAIRAAATPAPGGRRILLVEDNAVNQLVAAELLARAGYSYDSVANGNQAVEAIFSQHYDVVLMDCQMPGMDGFEATKIIREREQNAGSGEGKRHVAIIALTANALKGDRERCIAAGMDGYCPKPFKAKQLLAAIESVLSNTASPAGLEQFSADSAAHASSAGANQSSFDLESLLERCMDNLNVVKLILEKFKEQTSDQLRELDQNASAGNTEQIARLAHALKGAAGMASAQRCHAIAAELEQLARNTQTDQIGASLALLHEEFRLCVREMPKVFASLSSPSRQNDPQLAEAT